MYATHCQSFQILQTGLCLLDAALVGNLVSFNSVSSVAEVHAGPGWIKWEGPIGMGGGTFNCVLKEVSTRRQLDKYKNFVLQINIYKVCTILNMDANISHN